jgi:hypothetical protein
MSAGVLFLVKFWKFSISKNKKDYFMMTHDISVVKKFSFIAL